MKSKLSGLIAVFFMVSLSSSFARDFTYSEKLVMAPLKRTLEVKQYMEANINTRELSLREYLSYQLMKAACTPLNEAIEKIRKSDDSLKDQSEILSKLYIPCSEGGLGLSHLYVSHK